MSAEQLDALAVIGRKVLVMFLFVESAAPE
jgi:hypothetical protein